MRFRALSLAVLLPAAVGCYPVTQLQGPRTVARGELQGAVAHGLQIPGRTGAARGLPFDAALRVGVLDNVDIGFRTRPALSALDESVFELGTKIQLVREKEIELSIAPSVMQALVDRAGFDDEDITPDERSNFRFGRLAVLIGTNADDIGSLWFAPTLDAGERRFRADDRLHVEPLLALGSCAGVGIRLGPHVQLLVQSGLSVGLAGAELAANAGNNYATILGPGDLIGEMSFGVLFGGFRD